MDPACGICEEPLGERPTLQLLCHHFFHTECMLAHIVTTNYEDLHLTRCLVCDTHVFLNDNDENEHGIAQFEQPVQGNEEIRISTLYDTNEEFRKDIKKYMAATRGVSKPRLAFQKLCQAKKVELAPTYALMKAQYEGLYAIKKEQLVTSDEYKAVRRAEAKYTRHWSILREKYNIRSSSLETLRTKRGCKSIHRLAWWRTRPQSLIRRALRLRLPRW